MAFVDNVIQYLRKAQGERIVLESDKEAIVYRAGGSSVPTGQKLAYAQLKGMIEEIIPDEQRMAFSTGHPVLFPYTGAGGSIDVEASQPDGILRIILGADSPVPSIPEPEAASAHGQSSYAGPLKKIGHIDELFRMLKDVEGSDLHLSSNDKPFIRVHGIMKKLDEYEVNDPVALKKILWDIVPQRNKTEWEKDHDSDFAYEIAGVARFRCNIFADRHGPGAVFRLIPSQVLTARQLNLPQTILDLCFMSKGLVVVTGPTGSGKSTTLAAIIDHINKHRDDHIITIEDPVEFVHNNINCLVNQREVHVHTNSFSRALRAALREDPDICLVGEMRDLETVAIAIETAETGHLVFGTLHTTTAATTVDRIIDQFPADQQEQIRVMLSESLKAVIAQTLCRTVEGKRIAALEILIVDPAAANLIREGKTYQLTSMMQIGKSRGCITMNDSLFAHVKSGVVAPKEAYVKSVDKVGLLGMYEKENIKLDLGTNIAD